MKKASIIMAVLACAMIAAAYTNSVPISTNTRAATEKWTAIRFEPALPPTPANAASKFLNGNREWQTAPAELDPVANAALAVHTNRIDNPHSVTASQIGALTAEQDLAALRTYHYGSPDIVESPAEWFVFDGAGTITAFNWSAGRTNVVIPWAIGGVPVTTIGSWAFCDTGLESGYPITSLIAPQTVTAIGDSAFTMCSFLATVALPQATTIGFSAFYGCSALTSVNLPQATTIGDYAFTYCASLTSVHMGQNAPAETAYVFANITPPPNVYVTDPQATGWAATWNGAPVVRPPLHGSNVTAQAYTLNGDTITEWPAGGGGATNITDGVTSGTYSEATRTLDISNLLAGVSMELPDGIVTNGQNNVVLGTSTINGDLTITPSGIGTAFWSMNRFDGQPLFHFAQVYGGGSWDLEIRRNALLGYVSALYLKRDGAIGINTDTPSSALDVKIADDGDGVKYNGFRVRIGDTTLFAVSSNGVVSCASTCTAAVVSSQSGYLLPHLGTNTTISLIFTNGTLQVWEIAP